MTDTTSAALQTQLADGSLAGSWTLDSARSSAALRARHMWGLAPVNGYFRVITGEAVVAPGGGITGHITLATGSVDTKNAKRDEHLRGADFLVTEKYPEITFNLDTLMSAGEGVTIAGRLTVRDVSRSISFPATVVLSDDGAATFQATVEVDRSEYGITVNRLGGMVKLQCSVTLNAVFIRV